MSKKYKYRRNCKQIYLHRYEFMVKYKWSILQKRGYFWVKNNKKHKKGKLISKTIISLILLLIIFLLLENVVEKLNISTQSYAEKMEEKQTEVEETLPNGDSDSNPKNDELNDNSENDESECMYKYLSDIEYIKEEKRALSVHELETLLNLSSVNDLK